MLEFAIIAAVALGAIAFMVVFFFALCRDGRPGEHCHVVRIGPEQSAAGERTVAHRFAAEGAVRGWAALHHGARSSRALKVIEMPRQTELSPRLRNRSRK